jgi:hypothetical protein
MQLHGHGAAPADGASRVRTGTGRRGWCAGGGAVRGAALRWLARSLRLCGMGTGGRRGAAGHGGGIRSSPERRDDEGDGRQAVRPSSRRDGGFPRWLASVGGGERWQ